MEFKVDPMTEARLKEFKRVDKMEMEQARRTMAVPQDLSWIEKMMGPAHPENATFIEDALLEVQANWAEVEVRCACECWAEGTPCMLCHWCH